jgi:hypothetical protein
MECSVARVFAGAFAHSSKGSITAQRDRNEKDNPRTSFDGGGVLRDTNILGTSCLFIEKECILHFQNYEGVIIILGSWSRIDSH